MCPACLATAALIAAGTASAGGLTALVAKKIRKNGGKLGKKTPQKIGEGEKDESSQNSF